MKFMFGNQAFSFETLRAIGYAAYDGADIGEVVVTANRITEGDVDSWWREWNATAERVATIAEDCLSRGHVESARCAFLRASNYFRTAEFFLCADATGVRPLDTWRRSVDCFTAAAQIVGDTWRRVEIPYRDITLPGIFFTVDTTGAPRPTLLFVGGFDSTAEELYFAGAAAALRHGWNCLVFEGPGQGRVIREQDLPFRHDWEAVVSPVVDFAEQLPGVDRERLALMGMSLGGYFAPRAAAFEPRIKAVVAFDGLLDPVANSAVTGTDPEDQGTEADVVTYMSDRTRHDDAIYEDMKASPELDWLIRHGMWTHHSDTPSAFIARFAEYDLREVAHRITAPSLILEAENDHFCRGQGQRLYAAVPEPKTLITFTAAEGAEEHCHEGAMTLFHQRLFDWLDETLVAPSAVN